MLFSHHPFIPFVAFLSTSHLSHQIQLFSPPIDHSLFSSYVQTTSTPSALLNQPPFITPILLDTSFLTQSKCVTPHILFRHLISITFNLIFSVTVMFQTHRVQLALGIIIQIKKLRYELTALLKMAIRRNNQYST